MPEDLNARSVPEACLKNGHDQVYSHHQEAWHAQIYEQVDRIVGSPIFSTSELLSRFLRFVVREALEGRTIKAATIGAEVFYETKTKKTAKRGLKRTGDEDSRVRVEAIRLRAKLREYYDTLGVLDPIIIEVPKGGYAPIFTKRRAAPAQAQADDTSLSAGRSTPSIHSRPRRSLKYAISLAILLIFFLAVCLWKFWNYRVAELTREPLTTLPGNELFPAFSPDGKQIAFAWNGEGERNFNIYVKLVGQATAPLRVTSSTGDDVSPAWSPDGRNLAFVRLDAAGASVYVVSALGGGERRITELHPIGSSSVDKTAYRDWSPEGRSRYLDWSPDGSSLAFSDRISANDPLRIWLVSVNSNQRVPITQPPSRSLGDADPRFSPDGLLVSFQRTTSVEVSDIYVVATSGGNPRRITFFNHRTAGHAWTPDGREIVFSCDQAGPYNLWRVPISGDGAKLMPTMGDHALYPAIARQGSRLAYSELTVDDNIWRAEIAKKRGVATTLIGSTRRDLNPQYSPDASRIAFASDRSGSFEIWVSKADGSDARQVTRFGGPHTGTPRWSPDSKKLVFDSRPAGNADIYSVSADGGPVTRLTKDLAEDVVPTWDPSGDQIYFSSNRTGVFQVWRMDASGGNQQQVTRDGGFAGLPSVDGRSLYYVKSREIPRLLQVGLSSGVTSPRETSIRPWHWSAWTIAQNGIYFLEMNRQTPAHGRISFFDFSSGKVQTVFNLPPPLRAYTLGLSVSRDGKFALYSQVDDQGSDLVLVEHFR